MTTEAATRKDLIDAALRLAGWNLADPTEVIEEYEIDLIAAGAAPAIAAESASLNYGKQFADYALLVRGRIVAVIEAKRTSKDAQVGQEQGLQYAQHIQRLQGGPIPFVLYTNGHDIWLWESDFYPPIKVRGFPKPLELDWLDQRRRSRKPLSVEVIDKSIVERDYQFAAIRSVLEGV